MGELYVDPLELPIASRIKKEQRRIVDTRGVPMEQLPENME